MIRVKSSNFQKGKSKLRALKMHVYVGWLLKWNSLTHYKKLLSLKKLVPTLELFLIDEH